MVRDRVTSVQDAWRLPSHRFAIGRLVLGEPDQAAHRPPLQPLPRIRLGSRTRNAVTRGNAFVSVAGRHPGRSIPFAAQSEGLPDRGYEEE